MKDLEFGIGTWDSKALYKLILLQLKNFFPVSLPKDFIDYVELARSALLRNCQSINSEFVEDDLSPYHTVQWSIFLYYLSHFVGGGGYKNVADQLYYLNKIMNSVDWYWQIKLPQYFFAEHPVGSVLGRATYADYLYIYQGVTIGGNRGRGKLSYPIIGSYVLLCANVTIIGESRIGDYVICGANTYIKNEIISDCCFVFGQSPNLLVIKKTKQEMIEKLGYLWS